jgi:AcrR family transcriptional regulator
MSPRGVAIPGVRERLFSAAQVLLLREDAQPVTGRAVTREAGCATGLLNSHFGSFDNFLVEFALDRFRRHAAGLAKLPSLAGSGTVAGNLADAALALFSQEMMALSRLMNSRPGLIGRAVQEAAARAAGPSLLEEAFSGYLAGEQRIGRVSSDTDTDAIAVALVAVIHQLLLVPPAGGRDTRRLLQKVVVGMAHGMTKPAMRRRRSRNDAAGMAPVPPGT